MPLEEILEAIEAETDAEIARVGGEAALRSRALLEHAGARAAEEEERHGHRRDAAAERAAERIVNRARLDAERRLRAAREDVYREVMVGVEHRLEDLRATEGYERVLAALLEEALECLPEAREVRVVPEDVDRVRALLAGHEQVDVVGSLDGWGGVVAVAPGGRVVENTLRSRLARAGPDLRRVAGAMAPALRGGEW